jgi:hypothetical protein
MRIRNPAESRLHIVTEDGYDVYTRNLPIREKQRRKSTNSREEKFSQKVYAGFVIRFKISMFFIFVFLFKEIDFKFFDKNLQN